MGALAAPVTLLLLWALVFPRYCRKPCWWSRSTSHRAADGAVLSIEAARTYAHETAKNREIVCSKFGARVRVRTPFVFIAVDLHSIAVDRVHPPPRAADDPRPYERAKETGEKSEAEAGMKTGVH